MARVDSVVNLTVEAGNFAPPGKAAPDSVKTAALVDFFRRQGYDAIGLGSRELARGLKPWLAAAETELPVVAANVFPDGVAKKPLFDPYVVRKKDGRKLAVLGFVTRMAWDDLKDSTVMAVWKDPFEMGKVIRKAAKKSDHLTVLGEFQTTEAESLARAFPEIDLIVSTGIRTDHASPHGRSVIAGVSARGHAASYVEFHQAPKDSVDYTAMTQYLDDSVPVDSSMAKFIEDVKLKLQPPGQPAAATKH